MKTKNLSVNDQGTLDAAASVVRQGGIVAIPTDTVYGIGTSAFDERAVLKLYEVKGRSRQRSIPVLVSNLGQCQQVAHDLPPSAGRLAARFWPGPLTLVVSRGTAIADSVSVTATVGVRMPNHDFVLSLLDAVGPMAVTSANLSDQPSILEAGEVFDVMQGKIELVIDGGKTGGGVPSTVVDCTGPDPVILRSGPIARADIERAIS